jgi:phenylacetate-CoA ligase
LAQTAFDVKTIATAQLRSATAGVLWPAVPDRIAADVLALLYQLEQSEWFPRELLGRRQLEQCAWLVRHAYAESPFFRSRLAASGISPGQAFDERDFKALPILTRAELLAHADEIHCAHVPREHGEVGLAQTSGSTGQIVQVRRTSINQLFWLALGMRDHLWHRRDFRQTLAVVRAHTALRDDPEEALRAGWGAPATLLYPTGPCFTQPLSCDVATQAAWLVRRDPGYLLTYPTNLAALLAHFAQAGLELPSLKEVRTVGETLSDDVRARCREQWGVRVVDNYSSQEVGAIALECPHSGLYHAQAESLIVEVLDADGNDVAEGEIGRVVVTDLHNFATPLIRYDLRDHAEVGPACSCGRGLPTLRRILGRRRNMAVLPNGRRAWPLVGFARYREIAPVVQYQLVQHSLSEIEMRLVVTHTLNASQERALSNVVTDALGHAFEVRFSYFSGELPRTTSGKFEEFMCLIDDA